jgi:hypothetical protein
LILNYLIPVLVRRMDGKRRDPPTPNDPRRRKEPKKTKKVPRAPKCK